MAKEETIAAKATTDMFTPTDLNIINEALKLQHRTLQRKINTENNIDIRAIYQRQQGAVMALMNNLIGAMK